MLDSSFVIDEKKHVFLNGTEIKNATNVDIKNINPIDGTEVVLTVIVDEIDVKYKRALTK